MPRRFKDVVTELIPVYEAKAKKTYVEFESVTRLYLLPYFKDIAIDKVGASWRHYCAWARKQNASRKLWHDRKILRAILGYAFDCDLISKIQRLALDPFDKHKRRGLYVTEEDLLAVCDKASKTVADFISVLYDTGMRFSELRLLRLEYIDFKKKLIRLPAEIVKTRQPRVYPLPATVLRVIKSRVGSQKAGFLFTKRYDDTLPIGTSQREFQRALKRAGVSFTLHDLRRSFIVNCVKKGMPLEVVGRLVGASTAILRDVYLIVQEHDWNLLGG